MLITKVGKHRPLLAVGNHLHLTVGDGADGMLLYRVGFVLEAASGRYTRTVDKECASDAYFGLVNRQVCGI